MVGWEEEVRRRREKEKEEELRDVQILGTWNFTLQTETPLYWLRSGPLERYLMKFSVTCPPAPCTAGVVVHSEADSSGSDGVSFWIERMANGNRRYLMAGGGLESLPVITREYPDVHSENRLLEEVEVLAQGYSGCFFLQDRKIQVKFQANQGRGSVAFYNSTRREQADVHFAGVRITALRRGAVEINGILKHREEVLKKNRQRAEEAARQLEQLELAGPELDGGDEADSKEGLAVDTCSPLPSSPLALPQSPGCTPSWALQRLSGVVQLSAAPSPGLGDGRSGPYRPASHGALAPRLRQTASPEVRPPRRGKHQDTAFSPAAANRRGTDYSLFGPRTLAGMTRSSSEGALRKRRGTGALPVGWKKPPYNELSVAEAWDSRGNDTTNIALKRQQERHIDEFRHVSRSFQNIFLLERRALGVSERWGGDLRKDELQARLRREVQDQVGLALVTARPSSSEEREPYVLSYGTGDRQRQIETRLADIRQRLAGGDFSESEASRPNT